MRVTTRTLSTIAASFAIACVGASFFAASCGGGGGNSSATVALPPPTTITPTTIAHGADPGVHVTIYAVSGGSGAGGRFRAGDRPRIEYQLAKDDGTPWDIIEMTHGTVLVSGPTFDYQRVIAEQSDLLARSVRIGAGKFVYTFDTPIPTTYLPPLNDSDSFGPGDGELSGQTLLDGTYTVGVSVAWAFDEGHGQEVDAGEAAADFLFGDSAVLIPRAAVSEANCNRCHVSLRAHDGLHEEIRVCVLCHTSGAEDANDPKIEGGTPGISVDSRVLFHKIHQGHHLPSVVGVVAAPDGTLDYTVDPVPYRVVDAAGNVHDYSHGAVAIGPGHWLQAPEDFGYSALTPEAKERDIETREGLENCRSCHGDPDGAAGPLVAPAQGDIIYAEPQRRSCGACHDDVRWDRPYTTNQQTMDPQADDAHCTECHNRIGGTLAIDSGHRHPLLDTIDQPQAPFETAFNPGLIVDLFELDEWGNNDADGTIDPGEGILLHFNLTDDSGAEVSASALTRLTVNVSGPSENPQLLEEIDLPITGVSGAGHFVFPLSERLRYVLVGHSSAATGDVFTFPHAPLFVLPGAEPIVRKRTDQGGVSALTTAATAQSNFIDVDDPTQFERNVSIVIDEGVPELEEFLEVQFVDGHRLWFSSPAASAYPFGLKHAHAAGAVVQTVAFAVLERDVDYALDIPTGQITELQEFGDGVAVVVDATVAWQMPNVYPLAMNASDTLGDAAGKWTGKSIVSGVYRVTMQARIDKTLFLPGQQHVYPIVSSPSVHEIGVIDGQVTTGGGGHGHVAATFSEATCQNCHQDIWYHDGRERGLARCLACHGNAGIEDRPRYVSANAPSTPGISVEFRSLLHTIHMGAGYTGKQPFEVVAKGKDPYPDDFEVRTFDEVVYPAMPHGVAMCTKCHDDTLSDWREPKRRNHPTEQGAHVLAWRQVCGACHASDADVSHFDVTTSASGNESCLVCHGPNAINAVDLYHHGDAHEH